MSHDEYTVVTALGFITRVEEFRGVKAFVRRGAPYEQPIYESDILKKSVQLGEHTIRFSYEAVHLRIDSRMTFGAPI